MKLFILLFLVSCGCNSEAKDKPELPVTIPIANVDSSGYKISKFEDDDAICYTVSKTESISISCVKK